MITVKSILNESKGARFVQSTTITKGRNAGREKVVLEFLYKRVEKNHDGTEREVIEYNHATFIM